GQGGIRRDPWSGHSQPDGSELPIARWWPGEPGVFPEIRTDVHSGVDDADQSHPLRRPPNAIYTPVQRRNDVHGFLHVLEKHGYLLQSTGRQSAQHHHSPIPLPSPVTDEHRSHATLLTLSSSGTAVWKRQAAAETRSGREAGGR